MPGSNLTADAEAELAQLTQNLHQVQEKILATMVWRTTAKIFERAPESSGSGN